MGVYDSYPLCPICTPVQKQQHIGTKKHRGRGIIFGRYLDVWNIMYIRRPYGGANGVGGGGWGLADCKKTPANPLL